MQCLLGSTGRVAAVLRRACELESAQLVTWTMPPAKQAAHAGRSSAREARAGDLAFVAQSVRADSGLILVHHGFRAMRAARARASSGDDDDLGGLRTLGALRHGELHAGVFGKRLEAVALDLAEMREEVL